MSETLIQPQPPGFDIHEHSFEMEVATTPKIVWSWLNDPETFTKNQVWPYKVEFYSPDPAHVPNGFSEGVLTNHTGPFMSFAGILTKIESHYRDLQYCYGSYALSFNLIRPFRLEFETKTDGKSTVLHGKVCVYVRPSFYRIWDGVSRIFWRRFQRWARRNIMKIEKAQS